MKPYTVEFLKHDPKGAAAIWKPCRKRFSTLKKARRFLLKKADRKGSWAAQVVEHVTPPKPPIHQGTPVLKRYKKDPVPVSLVTRLVYECKANTKAKA